MTSKTACRNRRFARACFSSGWRLNRRLSDLRRLLSLAFGFVSFVSALKSRQSAESLRREDVGISGAKSSCEAVSVASSILTVEALARFPAVV
jgi:hypothetical protein